MQENESNKNIYARGTVTSSLIKTFTRKDLMVNIIVYTSQSTLNPNSTMTPKGSQYFPTDENAPSFLNLNPTLPSVLAVKICTSSPIFVAF